MKKLFFITLIILFNLNITAQFVPEHRVNIIPHGNTLDVLNGYGYSSLMNSVSNLGAINPAALGQFDKMSAGVSYQFEITAKDAWLGMLSVGRVFDGIPQSLGFVYPLNNLSLGLSFNQKYNSSFIYDIRGVVRDDQSETGYIDLGQTFEPLQKTKINMYSLTASYKFENIISNIDLDFGIRYNFNQLTEYFEENLNNDYKIDESVNYSSFSLGTVLKFNMSNQKYIKAGIFMDSYLEFNKKSLYTFKSNAVKSVVPGSRDEIYQTTRKTLAIIDVKYPSTLKLDLEFNLISSLKLFTGASYYLWDQTNSNEKDQLEFYGNAVLANSDLFTPSFGFMITDNNYKDDFMNQNDKLLGVYLIAGGVTKISDFDIHYILADSHLLSQKNRKETIFKLIVGYTL